MRRRKALDPGFGASAGLSEIAQWPRLDRPEPRLQAAWHDNTVCGARSLHRKDYRDAFKTPSPRRVSRLHEQCCAAFPNRKLHVILDNLNTHKKNEDWLKAQPLAFLAAQPHDILLYRNLLHSHDRLRRPRCDE